MLLLNPCCKLTFTPKAQLIRSHRPTLRPARRVGSRQEVEDAAVQQPVRVLAPDKVQVLVLLHVHLLLYYAPGQYLTQVFYVYGVSQSVLAACKGQGNGWQQAA